MKTKLWIVRHTETIGNIEKRLTGQKDYKITENGEILINLLTKELENVKFDRIYSSPSERAIDTIRPLAIKDKLPIEELDGLAEMYFGKYDGWKWEDVDKVQPEIKEQQRETNEIYGIPGQETTEEVTERMYRTILQIVKENIGKNILISSHGVAIEAFLRKIANQPFCKEREKFCQHYVAINEVEFENNTFSIRRLADISYLNKKLIDKIAK